MIITEIPFADHSMHPHADVHKETQEDMDREKLIHRNVQMKNIANQHHLHAKRMAVILKWISDKLVYPHQMMNVKNLKVMNADILQLI